jgi:hypothetical protein
VLPPARRFDPAPRRDELVSDADLELPRVAEPVLPIKPEALVPNTAELAFVGSRPQRLQKPPSIVPPQPGCVHVPPSISPLLTVVVVASKESLLIVGDYLS